MLREVFFENPHWIALGILIWIPVGAMIFTLLGAMIMDEIDILAGILGLSAAVLLGLIGSKPPDPSLTPIIFCVAVATWIFLPILRVGLNRREHIKMRIEAIESAYDALAERPDNLGAKLKLAKALYDQGLLGVAVGIADTALQGVSRRDYSDELRMVKGWKYRLSKRPDATRPLRCQRCGHVNSLAMCFCSICAKPYLLDYAKGWLRSLPVTKLLTTWMVAVGLMIGIPTLSKSAPPQLALVLIPVLILISCGLLWRTFMRNISF